jgi:hypothetical protein
MPNAKLQSIYNEAVIEALLAPPISKIAQEMPDKDSIVSAVKEYLKDKIDMNDPIPGVLNLLVPGILTSLGLTPLAVLYTVADGFFGVNLTGVFSSIKSSLMSLFSSKQPISESDVSSIVQSAVTQNQGESTEQDVEELENKKASSLTIEEAKIINYKLNQIHKLALNMGGYSRFAHFLGIKSTLVKVLIVVITFIVKTVLASAGFMVAKDIGQKLTGIKPSNPSVSNVSFPTSTQTVFKESPSIANENLNNKYNIWSVSNPSSQMEQAVTTWAIDVYPELASYKNEIHSSPNFQKLISYIQNYNDGNVTGMTFIPKEFRSRKQLVDTFIDDLAKSRPFKSPKPFKPENPSQPLDLSKPNSSRIDT